MAKDTSTTAPGGARKLAPAAERALAEAESRRAARAAEQAAQPAPVKEQGRQGLDPARFGDWENKGIASDF
jgi:hypothetical protein